LGQVWTEPPPPARRAVGQNSIRNRTRAARHQKWLKFVGSVDALRVRGSGRRDPIK
jgi:hypothetical protein